MPRPAQPIAERLERYTSRPVDTDCWLWTGSRNRDGYGKFQVCGRDSPTKAPWTAVVTWVAWFVHRGVWPTKGQEVLHSCDNPPCINPAHLRLGTHQDNMDDMMSKTRSAGARHTWNGGVKNPEHAHKARLNWERVGLIRQQFATGRYTQAVLARDNNVSEGAIFCVVHHRTWKV
jgi:hypothetical protein